VTSNLMLIRTKVLYRDGTFGLLRRVWACATVINALGF